MEYTKDQKMAISKVLLDIAGVDENIDTREITYFETVMDKLQLTAQDHFVIMHLNTLKCLSIIKQMTVEQKTEFAVMMRNMIVADKYIDPNEATSFYDICEFIQLNGIGLTKD